jgi:hypothetical protein
VPSLLLFKKKAQYGGTCLVLERLRQEDCKFKASLGYILSSKSASYILKKVKEKKGRKEREGGKEGRKEMKRKK